MAHCEAVETIFPLLCSPAELAVLGASLLAEPRRAIDEGAGASFAALENAWCSTDAALPACAPGWVAPPGALGELAANAAAAASAELMAHAARGASADEAAHTATVLAREVMDKAGASRRNDSMLTACPGYFSPAGLACLVPCPQGAWCPAPAVRADSPVAPAMDAAEVLAAQADKHPGALSAGGATGANVTLEGDAVRQAPACEPFFYTPSAMAAAAGLNDGCGGAQAWWSDCPGGYFCPDTTTRVLCPRGHFCPRGSSSPSRCPPPPFVHCPAGTEHMATNLTGAALLATAACLLAVAAYLVVLWQRRTALEHALARERAEERLRLEQLAAQAHRSAGSSDGAGEGSDDDAVGGQNPPFMGMRLDRVPTPRLPSRDGGSRSGASSAARRSLRWLTGRGVEPSRGRYQRLSVAVDDALEEGAAVVGSPLAIEMSSMPQAVRPAMGGGLTDIDLGDESPSEVPPLWSDLRPASPAAAAAAASAGAGAGGGTPFHHSRGLSLDYYDALKHAGEMAVTVRGAGSLTPVSTPRELHEGPSAGSSSDDSLSSEQAIELAAGAAMALAGRRPETVPGAMAPAPMWPPAPSAGELVKGARIVFRHLRVVMRDTGVCVLQDLNGELPSASISAVLGPSGAGKTFFCCALADRLSHNAAVSGSVLLNDRFPVRAMRRVLGFCPQDDVMHVMLTVYENLIFSARMRLRQRRRNDHLRLVERAIRLLDLECVRHSRIGSDARRGISGGQRKRVNVGMELVIDPAILFLDEPTSGLDSATARQVLDGVRRAARGGPQQRGITVVSVLHQPPFELVQKFSVVVLMARGGRIAYLGPCEGLGIFFGREMGLNAPAAINPADFWLDCLTMSSADALPGPGATAAQKEAHWRWVCSIGAAPAAQAAARAAGVDASSPLYRAAPISALLSRASAASSAASSAEAAEGGLSRAASLAAEDAERVASRAAVTTLAGCVLWSLSAARRGVTSLSDFVATLCHKEPDLSGRPAVGFWRQLPLVMHRAFLTQYARQAEAAAWQYSLLTFAGAAVGCITPPTPTLPHGEGPFANAGTALILLVGVGAQVRQVVKNRPVRLSSSKIWFDSSSAFSA